MRSDKIRDERAYNKIVLAGFKMDTASRQELPR